MNELATSNYPDAATMESLIIGGDLSKLTPAQRVSYYGQVCKSIGLNPLTKPFEYINLNGKLTLYARKDATDQLRQNRGISIEKPDIQFQEDWIIVTVSAYDKDNRRDSDIGVVSRKDMRGDFGNALMKAVTKAKRRVTLSICGLGMLDETEVETIPTAQPVKVAETGEIIETQIKETQPKAEIIPGIPAELAHLANICNDDGTPYPLIPTDKLSYMYNSLSKALKANGLDADTMREKTIKCNAAKEIIDWRNSHPAA